MDIDLARTFLEVVACGNFVGAAERLNVTQSTISMRIRSLEQQLGRSLFERSKAGASLTSAGNQFHRHALALIRVWEQARHDVALPKGYDAVLAAGGQISLWDSLLLPWLARMRATVPEVALRGEFGFSSDLMSRLVDGLLDLAVMYTPESRPGLVVEMLLEDELVLVTSKTDGGKVGDGDYIYIDWGPEFQRDHGLHFPELSMPGIYLRLGSLALRYLLDAGGSGYFPRRIVRRYLDDKRLALVPRAPVFTYPAYVIYPGESDSAALPVALEALREIAARESAT